MTPEVTSSHRCLLGEGPVWDANRGRLVFVDILRGLVHALEPTSGDLDTFVVGSPVGAAVPRAQGGYILTTGNGFAVLEENCLTLLCQVDEGLLGGRFNDGKCDHQGRLFAGTQSDVPEQRASALYRLDGAGVTLVLAGVGISNGLDWSEDGKTLYYVDSLAGGIDTFRFDHDEGSLTERRRFVNVPPPPVLADGLAVDAEGGIWLALFAGSCVHRYSPEGTLDAVIRFPVSLVTSCGFGGPDLDELYVTSAAHRLLEPEPLAGSLFRVDVGVRGRPATAFSF